MANDTLSTRDLLDRAIHLTADIPATWTDAHRSHFVDAELADVVQALASRSYDGIWDYWVQTGTWELLTAFEAHQRLDPHCTCPDCVQWHDDHTDWGDTRWWRIARPNRDALYGYGTREQAERFAGRLNVEGRLEIDLYTVEEAPEYDERRRNDGFNFDEADS